MVPQELVLIPLVIRVIQSYTKKHHIASDINNCLNPLSNQGHSIELNQVFLFGDFRE